MNTAMPLRLEGDCNTATLQLPEAVSRYWKCDYDLIFDAWEHNAWCCTTLKGDLFIGLEYLEGSSKRKRYLLGRIAN